MNINVIYLLIVSVIIMVSGQQQPPPQPPPLSQQQDSGFQQQPQQGFVPPASQPVPQAPAASSAESNQADTLPASADLIIGQLQPGFTCANKVYGYYADIQNDCRVFHVCWPITDEKGNTLIKEWSFICGNQTLFNQERLVCDRPENVDCSQSETYYSVNNDFGKIPEHQ